jgi:hypothetical protein
MREQDKGVEIVIASEAKQSILPICDEMDCFAALAMTGSTFQVYRVIRFQASSPAIL